MRKVISIIVISMMATQVWASSSIEELWKNMPDSIISYFNAAVRTEMLDMYNITHGTKTKNLLGGQCWIDSISNDLIEMHINESTTLQIATFTCNDSTKIMCMVKGYGQPAHESSISFYTDDWKRIDSTFGLPDTKDAKFMLNMLTHRPDSISESKYIESLKMIEPVMVTATITSEHEIVFSISSSLLTKDENCEVDKIKKKKCFKWNGKTFK